jgi:antirestriction protein ArdC
MQANSQQKEDKMATVYEATTSKFIALVEQQGYLPWQKPWQLTERQNYFSKRPYHGANVLFTMLGDIDCPFFATFKQITEAGGQVAKGAKGVPIVFAGKREVADEEITSKTIFRYFTVFSLRQTTGLTLPELTTNRQRIAVNLAKLESEAFPVINYLGDAAYYSPSSDTLTLPTNIADDYEFHSCLFHELAHSTGHPSRLHRELVSQKANEEAYSFEELVAEISAAFCMAHFGLTTTKTELNSAAYVHNWLQKLAYQPDWLIKAASRAQKAADYIISNLTKEN